MEQSNPDDPTMAGQSLVPKLEVIKGPQIGKTYQLAFKTRIGRETDNDITLPDPRVSRYHCQVSFDDAKWQVADLGSANGTTLNGLPITVPQTITHGDQLSIGETVLVFRDPLEEQEEPFDPASTIVGGNARPPAPKPAPQASQTSQQTLFIGLGVIAVLLLIAIGLFWMYQSRNAANNPAQVQQATTAPVRTTPVNQELVLQLDDDFTDSNSGWDDSFGQDYTKQYGNNQYHIEINTNDLVVWGLANRNAADFEVEVEASLQQSEPGNTFGLIFRYVDFDNYYRFDVSDEGYYLLSKLQNDEWHTLIDWTYADAIHQGNDTNVLKISAFGPEITLYANGEELGSASDPDGFGEGNFGFFASTFSGSNIWTSFDNLKLWAPTGQEIAVIPTITPTPYIANTPTPLSVTIVEVTSQPEETVAEAASPQPEADETLPVEETATPEPTVELLAAPTATPLPTEAPLPDFVSHDQPLARGQEALSGKITYPLYDPARGTYDIYQANPDGSARTLLVSEASQPAVNQDGTQIAYRSWIADKRGLVSQNIGGNDPWIFVNFVEAASPRFSPGNDFFLFHSRQGGRTPALYRTFGTEHEVLRRDGAPIQGEMLTISQDGRLAYRGCLDNSCGLMSSNLDGGDPRLLTDYADDTAPAWSPDGNTLAFMSNRDGDWDVYTIDADGQNLAQLTDNTVNDGIPTWSPDGTLIAYVSNKDGEWAIWGMGPNGQQPRQFFDLDGTIDGVVQIDVQNSFGWLEERIVWTTD